MTKLEAAKDYQYDVSLFYNDNGLWYWDINGGYSSISAHNGYFDPRQCEEELDEFLKTFEPFEK